MESELIPIPIVGIPLAGKYTIISALSSVYSSQRLFGDTVVEKGLFAGKYTTVYVNIGKDSSICRVQTVPGGVPQEALLNLLQGAKRAVFVSDPQTSWREIEMSLWASVRDFVPREGWYFIINKMDLVRRGDIDMENVESEDDARELLRLRGIYDDRPLIMICARMDEAKGVVRTLFDKIVF